MMNACGGSLVGRRAELKCDVPQDSINSEGDMPFMGPRSRHGGGESAETNVLGEAKAKGEALYYITLEVSAPHSPWFLRPGIPYRNPIFCGGQAEKFRSKCLIFNFAAVG